MGPLFQQPSEAPKIVLRPYQRQGLLDIHAAIKAGHRRILVVMPTGCGKGSLLSQMMKGTAAQGLGSLFVVHRSHLVDDIAGRIDAHGVGHSVVLPGYPSIWNALTYVATIQSWLSPRRLKSIGAVPRLILVDECHMHNSRSGMYKRLTDMYPDAIFIGFTATPLGAGGRGLGGFYQVMVHPISYKQAFEEGYLVRPRYFTPADRDLRRLLDAANEVNGDLDPDEVGPIMEQPKIVGDIVSHYLKYGEDRTAVGFAVRVAHSKALCEAFEAAGISSAHIDAETPKWERDRIFAGLRDGSIRVVWNVNVLAEGLDIPNVGCIIDASPTKSIIRWLQRIGRGLRPSPGKVDCIVIDHGGTFNRLSGVESYETWSLENKPGANSRKPREEERERRIKEITCKGCGTVFSASIVCPSCGYVHDSTKIPEYIDGDLAEVTDVKSKKKKERVYTDQDKLDWVQGLNYLKIKSSYSSSWVRKMYESKFHEPPPFSLSTKPPIQEVRNWVRHRNMAHAKAKERDARLAALDNNS